MMLGMPRRAFTDLPPEVLAAIEAFGTPARVAIVDALRTYEPTTKTHIAEVVGIDYKVTLYHMGILERLGVVIPEKMPGRKQALYSVDVTRARELHMLLARALGI